MIHMIHSIEKTRSIKMFVFGSIAGMLMTLLVVTFIAVKPRFNALVKAWNNYQVVEDLEIKTNTSIAKK